MMKICCSVVIILCTLDVSHSGILSGQCLSSNGSCGQRGYSCDATFEEGWKQYGRCCNERPCCKLAPCVSETCPTGYRLTFSPSQASTTNCYFVGESASWVQARGICASVPGAYLWRPNTIQEADAVINDFNIRDRLVWTGANDIDEDGLYTFDIENSSFAPNALPFGTGLTSNSKGYVCWEIILDTGLWRWFERGCYSFAMYICEYPRRVCP
ncbi:uncharacterized protein [Mytilus edulis]|uniref:uncharacterized protein n=1 Tax=Mytilus edulis TaxID=6550 RepID=UPI0039EE295F